MLTLMSFALTTQLLTAAPAQLTLDIKPDGVEVKVDGKKAGTSGTKTIMVKLSQGKHVVRLSYKGDSHEEEVAVKAGEKKTWSFAFESTKPTAMPTDEQATPSE